MGRLDRAELDSAQLGVQISKLQGGLDKRSFVIDLRKLYWSLIANQISLDLSNQLVKTAKQQLAQSKQKLKEGLGDSGDVARNQAQLSSRESSAMFFSYQKELLFAQLKSQLPQLKDSNMTLNTAQVNAVEIRTRQCMAQIAGSPTANLKLTPFDDIQNLLNKQQQKDLRVAESTDAMDVKLSAKYQASGVDQGHSAAFEQLEQDFLNGYEVGLSLNIPLGSDTTSLRKAQANATKLRYEAQKQQLALNIQAEHQKIQKAMQLLIQASRSQQETIKSLKTSLKKTKRKYKQARIPLNTLILEQDNLFQSELSLIDTKRQILHLLLDYFKIFSSHPCSINQIQGGLS